MKTWLKNMGDALGMGLAWGAGWAFLGMAIEVFEPDPSFIDVWVTTLAIPGFAGGVVFSIVLQLTGRGFDQLASGRAITFGALAGVLLALLVIATTTLLDAPPGPRAAAVVIAASTLLSAVTAAGLRVLAERLRAFRLRKMA